MTVGDRIKERRIALGLTQDELAKRMGYSGKSTVCKAESTGDNVTTTKVKKFAEHLDCDWKYLMGWIDLDGNEIQNDNPYTADTAKLTTLMVKDKELTEALTVYFGLSSKKKQKVIDFIFLLAED